MTHNTHLECLPSRVLCCHSDCLNPHGRQTVNILFSQNVQWCDDYLYPLLLEQEGHPECECFSRACCCNGDNIFVVLEYSLHYMDLPKTWSVTKNFLSSASLLEMANLVLEVQA